MTTLSDLDLAVLAFEHRRYRHAGAREEAITVEFGMTPTAYAQHLNRLLDDPAAYLHDPVLVKRLRRLRDTRRASRGSRAS